MCLLRSRTFYYPGRLPPSSVSAFSAPFPVLFLGRGQHGPEHPDSGFRAAAGSTQPRPCNRSTSRRNTPCHGFHDNSRYTIRRAVRTIWHGTWIIATQNVVNSIRKQRPLLRPVLLRCQRPCSGSSSAAHAFRLQARHAITMYAQLLTRLSTGIASACTPPLQLRDQVLLVAAVVGQEDDLRRRRRRGRW